MRLKGGKVLLDLAHLTLGDEPEVTIDDLTINAILDKGLCIKINVNDIVYVHSVIFNTITDGAIGSVASITDSENSKIYDIILDIENKKLKFVIEE